VCRVCGTQMPWFLFQGGVFACVPGPAATCEQLLRHPTQLLLKWGGVDTARVSACESQCVVSE
jgi:hypothetical protein